MKSENTITRSAVFTAVLCGASSSAFALEASVEVERSAGGPRTRYVLSARGPGEGRTAFAAAATFAGVVPLLDLRTTWGLSERWDFDVQLSGPLLVTRAALGPKLRLLRTEHLAFALKGAADFVFIPVPTQPYWSANVKPSALLSVGGEDLEFTFEAGLPIVIAGSEGGLTSDPIQFLELSAGVEFDAVTSVNALIQVSAWLARAPHGDLVVIPFLSVGGAI